MPFVYFKDPLYGFIEIPKTLISVIDSLEMQRLRRIKQLAGAEFVYPGANHTRFEHSLGTFNLASKLINKLQKAKEGDITKDDEMCVKIAALLHDVGHGPFSHAFEEILDALYNQNHEDITENIIKNSEITQVIENLGLAPKKIAALASGRYNKEKKYFLDQIICSAIDCDALDYLIRDSYHCGSQFGMIDVQRILLQVGILENWNLGFNVKSLPNLESYLLARLNSFRTIYFHKTSRGVQLMLVKAMKAILPELNLSPFNAQTYLQWDDFSMWQKLKTHNQTRHIIEDISRRKLPKMIYEKHTFSEKKQIFKLAGSTRAILEGVATKTGILEENLLIDTPITPSIPYFSSINMRPNEIPIFKLGGDERLVELQNFQDSFIFALLQDKNIKSIRIYATEKTSQDYKSVDWSFLDDFFL